MGEKETAATCAEFLLQDYQSHTTCDQDTLTDERQVAGYKILHQEASKTSPSGLSVVRCRPSALMPSTPGAQL